MAEPGGAGGDDEVPIAMCLAVREPKVDCGLDLGASAVLSWLRDLRAGRAGLLSCDVVEALGQPADQALAYEAVDRRLIARGSARGDQFGR